MKSIQLHRRANALTSRLKYAITAAVVMVAAAGCSPRDEYPKTPVFQSTTPTYRSSVHSNDLPMGPLYSQPGLNSGKKVHVASIASQATWDANDPTAYAVYLTLSTAPDLQARLLRVEGHKGIVYVQGVVPNAEQLKRALDLIRGVSGVKGIKNRLHVSPPSQQ